MIKYLKRILLGLLSILIICGGIFYVYRTDISFYRLSSGYKLIDGFEKQAIDAYSEFIKNNPEYAKAYTVRAEIYEKLGYYEQARKDLETAIVLADDTKGLHLKLAYFYYDKDMTAETLIELNKEVEKNKNSDESYVLMGNIYSREDNFEKSIQSYTNAIDISKKSEYYYLRANSYISMNNIELAISDLKSAINLDKDNSTYAIKLSELYYNSGNTKLAIETIKKVLNELPLYANGWFLLSKANLKDGDLAQALKDINKAILLEENDLQMYLYRADIYDRMQANGKAVSDLKKAKKLGAEGLDGRIESLLEKRAK